MMEVKWLKEALQDLKEIGRFIAQDDPAAAYRVLSKIEAAAQTPTWSSRNSKWSASRGCGFV